MIDRIEIRPALLDAPRVLQMGRHLMQSEEFLGWAGLRANIADEMLTGFVVGTLVRVWAAARALAPDGTIFGAGLDEIDRLARVPGFAAAMRSVGWLELELDAVTLPNWEEHNPGPATKRKGKKKGQEPEPVGAAFAAFWAAYPKKADRPCAENAWRKIEPDLETVRQILQGLERYKKSDQWIRDEGRFIPNPGTWLNGRRWEDQVGVAPAEATGPTREEMIAEQRRRRQQLREQQEKARRQREQAQHDPPPF